MWGFKRSIKIFDTTLRDGEQMPGVIFSPEEKIELAIKSSEFGCHFINLMPSVSDSEAILTKKLSNMNLEAEITADCMIKKEHVEKTLDCNVPRIVLFTSLSDLHLEHKLKISREENLKRTLEMIDIAREHDVKIDFAGEDATRADMNYLIDFANSISKYIEYFLPADTLGCMTPFQTYDFFKKLKRECKCQFCIHSHNDFGLATANVLAALRAGVGAFSGTFTGIGERAGNSPIEEVCVALKYLHGIDMGVKFDKLKEICSLVEKYSQVPVQKHKPIVGENAFVHESGIHVNGVIKHTRTYENFEPEIVGQKRKFLFGKHSGSSGINYVLEKYGKIRSGPYDFLGYIKHLSETERRVFSEEEVMRIYENKPR